MVFRAAVSVLIGPCCPALLESYSRKCAYCCIIGQNKWWWWLDNTARTKHALIDRNIHGMRRANTLGIQGGQKWGHRLMTIILSILNRFNSFFTERFLGKFAVKRISTIPPHLACVATLPGETLMLAKQAINDKLQGSVATCWKYDGVVDNQIKNDLLPSLRVKTFLKSMNIWQSYKQERDCLVHFLRLLAACRPSTQVARFWPTL